MLAFVKAIPFSLCNGNFLHLLALGSFLVVLLIKESDPKKPFFAS